MEKQPTARRLKRSQRRRSLQGLINQPINPTSAAATAVMDKAT
jgi:hypothetical protein